MTTAGVFDAMVGDKLLLSQMRPGMKCLLEVQGVICDVVRSSCHYKVLRRIAGHGEVLGRMRPILLELSNPQPARPRNGFTKVGWLQERSNENVGSPLEVSTLSTRAFLDEPRVAGVQGRTVLSGHLLCSSLSTLKQSSLFLHTQICSPCCM